TVLSSEEFATAIKCIEDYDSRYIGKTLMPIRSKDQNWILETARSAYVFGVNQNGLLTHRYWGPRLPTIDDVPAAVNPISWASFDMPAHLTPQEYPAYGEMDFTEPCLKVTFADGVRSAILRFESADIRTVGSDSQLDLVLRDTYYPFRLTLHYRVH